VIWVSTLPSRNVDRFNGPFSDACIKSRQQPLKVMAKAEVGDSQLFAQKPDLFVANAEAMQHRLAFCATGLSGRSAICAIREINDEEVTIGYGSVDRVKGAKLVVLMRE